LIANQTVIGFSEFLAWKERAIVTPGGPWVKSLKPVS